MSAIAGGALVGGTPTQGGGMVAPGGVTQQAFDDAINALQQQIRSPFTGTSISTWSYQSAGTSPSQRRFIFDDDSVQIHNLDTDNASQTAMLSDMVEGQALIFGVTDVVQGIADNDVFVLTDDAIDRSTHYEFTGYWIAGTAPSSYVGDVIISRITHFMQLGLLARSQDLVGSVVSQQTFDDTVADLRSERIGVNLTGGGTSKTRIQNVNVNRSGNVLIDSISYSPTLLTQAQMSPYDHIRLEVYELSDANVIIDSTVVTFRYQHWNSLKAVPYPDQALALGANTANATIVDNRSLRFSWNENPPAFNDLNIPGSGGARFNRLEEGIEDLNTDLRESQNVLYIGKSIEDTVNQNAVQMLIAISGISNSFDIAAYGYR